MSMHLTVVGFIGLTASSLSAASPPAVPQVVVEGRAIDPETQRQVRYSDLNLSRAVDRATLMRRVGQAVDDLCDNDANSVEVLEHTNRPCLDAAWQTARPQIDAAFARGAIGQAAVSATIAISAVPQH